MSDDQPGTAPQATAGQGAAGAESGAASQQDAAGEVTAVGEGATTGEDAAGQAAPTPELRLRRAPRYRAVVITGAAVAVLVAAVSTVALPVTGRYSAGSVFGYLAVSLGLFGALLGAAVAVLVERPRHR